jgi:hypothetical protein
LKTLAGKKNLSTFAAPFEGRIEKRARKRGRKKSKLKIDFSKSCSIFEVLKKMNKKKFKFFFQKACRNKNSAYICSPK